MSVAWEAGVGVVRSSTHTQAKNCIKLVEKLLSLKQLHARVAYE